MRVKPVVAIPEWLLLASPKAMFNAKEVCALFGFSSSSSLSNSIASGSFPAADGAIFKQANKTNRWVGMSKAHLWSKPVIMAEIKRRQAVDCTGEQ